MTTPEDIAGPIIVWLDYGYEGWQPRSYPTLKDALEGERYGYSFVITKKAEYRVVETEKSILDLPDVGLPTDVIWTRKQT